MYHVSRSHQHHKNPGPLLPISLSFSPMSSLRTIPAHFACWAVFLSVTYALHLCLSWNHLSSGSWLSMDFYLNIAFTQLPGKLHKRQSWPHHSPTLRPPRFPLSLQNKTQGVRCCEVFHVWPSLILMAHPVLLPDKTTPVLMSRTHQGLLKAISWLVMLPLITGLFPHLFAYLPPDRTVKTHTGNDLYHNFPEQSAENSPSLGFRAHTCLFTHIIGAVCLLTRQLHWKCG